MAMLEKQRLMYLDILGIDSYMPQRLLPGAAPSHLLSAEHFSAEDAAAVGSSDALSVVHDSSSHNDQTASVATLAATLAALNSTDTPPLEASAVVQPDSKDKPDSKDMHLSPKSSHAELEGDIHNGSDMVAVSPSAQIKFSLNVWRIKDELLVIDSRQPGAALPTDRLLQNILRVVGYPMAQLPTSELLRWPLFKDDASAHSENEARAMVQAYVSAQCAKSMTKAILLLGRDAVRFSLSIDNEINAYFEQYKGTCITQPQWNTSALVAPSLIDMLQQPEHKAITWQALQSLCAISS